MRKDAVAGFSARLSYCPHCMYIYAGFAQCFWGGIITSGVGQHIDPLLLVIFSSGVV
jgi:hypothetical protein